MKTEFKHTKGKWHFRTGMSDNYSEIIGDIGTNKVIAVTPKDCFVNQTEAEANGRLIAAAPDLLEALSELFSLLEENEPQWYLRGHYNHTIKAINKATL
jgi:hypothetical protein